jgi:hypothetical protein
MKIIFLLLGLLLFNLATENPIINPAGTTITTRINPPQGYRREPLDSASFGYYLQNFPLKKHGSKVYQYDGKEKWNATVHEAVLNIDVGDKDLQQCADAVMRLRAEYLYKRKQYDKIHFNFTNGFNAEYKKWAEGYRIKVNGNTTTWYKAGEPSYSYKEFRKYLELVFNYAGTLSLSKDLKTVSVNDIQAGDVFIKGGSPGHTVLVMDIAVNSTTGKKVFLVAQSYMPAQDIHVLKNFEQPNLSPWYDVSAMDKLYTPEWTFSKTELKRF